GGSPLSRGGRCPVRGAGRRVEPDQVARAVPLARRNRRCLQRLRSGDLRDRHQGLLSMFEFFGSALEHLGTYPYAQLSLTVWALILLALTFDFLNGLHDAANSIATVVSTRVLSPQWAVI